MDWSRDFAGWGEGTSFFSHQRISQNWSDCFACGPSAHAYKSDHRKVICNLVTSTHIVHHFNHSGLHCLSLYRFVCFQSNSLGYAVWLGSVLTLYLLGWVNSHFFNPSGLPECQTVRVQIRLVILSGLICKHFCETWSAKVISRRRYYSRCHFLKVQHIPTYLPDLILLKYLNKL